MMYLLNVVLLSFFTLICASTQQQRGSYFKTMFPRQEEIPAPSRIAGKVIDQAIKEIQKKYPVFPVGVGMGGEFKYLGLDLEIHKTLSLDEARAMHIDCQEMFLEEINSSERLRPYLDPYPFTVKETGMTIFISHDDGSRTVDPHLCVVRTSGGAICYKTNDPDDTFKYKWRFEETREEALKRNAEYLAKRGKSALDE